ncbi:MAG: DEAD/DEAH box helicase family protein, partial [Syntrophomonadaceae bacterium]|nr:DEAD/DEAH box helicase family protein [Syntrophomonadaceae bacterium]
RQVRRELQRLGLESFLEQPLYVSDSGASIDYFSLHRYEDVLEGILQGRIYYRREIERRLRESGTDLENLDMLLHLMTLRGTILRVPAVKISGETMACNRCGHNDRIKRAFCQVGRRECYFCEGCLMLGESTPCEALYAAPARTRVEENYVRSVRLNLDISFSVSQYEAFETLARFVRRDSLTEAMVWTACGAGRTEMAFGAMREVLKRGGRVLVGVPRKEMTEELAWRLNQAFPGVSVAALQARPARVQKNPDIVLASTFQALKYYKNFDLVVLDEAEAFPHRASEMMVNALRRARKNEGKFIFITSTPEPALYARAQRGEVKVVMVPLRHHGVPLPVPRVLVESDIQGERKVPARLFGLVRESLEEDGAQLLVIVPDHEASLRVGAYLGEEFRAIGVQDLDRVLAATSAQDPERDRKVAAWVRGEFKLLVTTSLTRRGDQAPHTNMIILYADHEAFDEATLIQLAGRVGWSDAYPTGKVWLVAARMTRAIEGAVRKIRLLNEEAEKKGLLELGRQRRSDTNS